MIRHKAWVDGIYRVRGQRESRLQWLRLDKNERVGPLPDKFFRGLLRKFSNAHLTAYPETECLYEKLAAHHGVQTSNIMLTSGSDAAIRHGFELFVNPGDEVLVLEPTFAMIDIYCSLFHATRKAVAYDSALRLDVDELIAHIGGRVALVVISNPNSPTGTVISHGDMRRIVERAAAHDVPVLVDEAYYGFCPETALPLCSSFPNLIVTRTFSKSAGMAGLRIGYMIASGVLAQLLYKFRPMYEANAFGVLAAMEILNHPEVVRDYLAATEKGRKLLTAFLSSRGIGYRDTVTNFIHVDCAPRKQAALSEFAKRGILVGGGLRLPDFENYLRITLGPPQAMKQVVNVLNAIFPANRGAGTRARRRNSK